MASEEEREKILAEYKAAAAAGFNDEDNEADFDPAAYDSEEDAEFSGDDESEEEEAEPDPVVLNGSMHLNDEGRVILSGTWALQSQLIQEEKDSLNVNKPLKKHPKFKLKSQDKCEDDAGNNSKLLLFDICRPTLCKAPPSTAGNDDINTSLPTRRTMCFDGFFIQPPPETDTPKNGSDDNNEQQKQEKKIKERDIEIFFTYDNDAGSYRLSGRGYNEYGPFVLSDGTYTVHSGGKKARVKCNKTYGSGGDAKGTQSGSKRSRRSSNDDDSFDDDFDEKADYGEVNELCEDAGLSIEELRAKYYGGGGGGNDADGDVKVSASKRARLDDSDSDECGF